MTTPAISVSDLTIGYGDRIIQRDLTFDVMPEDVFVIMGGSGCGKSTLLRNLLGLERPNSGDVEYFGENFLTANAKQKQAMRKDWGVTFQSGALISAMTLQENLALPLELYTTLNHKQQAELIDYKLALVGLAGYQAYLPAEISGGMRKRAALAKATMLDPKLLFFDEPSAGLDPISSKRLDELIISLAQGLGATVIMVTHELASILSIANNAIYLDNQSRTLLEQGNPRDMMTSSPHAIVREFLQRGTAETDGGSLERT